MGTAFYLLGVVFCASNDGSFLQDIVWRAYMQSLGLLQMELKQVLPLLLGGIYS